MSTTQQDITARKKAEEQLARLAAELHEKNALLEDVMGHGVRAALVAAILRALVEDLRARATEPARFLQELNRGISHILKHTRLTMFVSACYLLVDIARGELRYANAGHPIPLCVHHMTSGSKGFTK